MASPTRSNPLQPISSLYLPRSRRHIEEGHRRRWNTFYYISVDVGIQLLMHSKALPPNNSYATFTSGYVDSLTSMDISHGGVITPQTVPSYSAITAGIDCQRQIPRYIRSSTSKDGLFAGDD